MHGQRSVVKDYREESINELEISIHSSPTSGGRTKCQKITQKRTVEHF